MEKTNHCILHPLSQRKTILGKPLWVLQTAHFMPSNTALDNSQVTTLRFGVIWSCRSLGGGGDSCRKRSSGRIKCKLLNILSKDMPAVAENFKSFENSFWCATRPRWTRKTWPGDTKWLCIWNCPPLTGFCQMYQVIKSDEPNTKTS